MVNGNEQQVLVLTERYDAALQYAREKHAPHRRWMQGNRPVPYLSHPLAVSALVIEAGGDEDQAIAGLLHDVVEDAGGQPRLDEIREQFGERVARIVEACSDWVEDATPDPRPLWWPRKRAYVGRLEVDPRTPPSSL